jgi:hypothetical protein
MIIHGNSISQKTKRHQQQEMIENKKKRNHTQTPENFFG